MITMGLASVIGSLISIYIYIVLLRSLLQFYGASFHNPAVQMLLKVTDPILVPLQKVIRGFKGFDMAAVALVVVLQLIKVVAMVLIEVHFFPNILGMLVVSIVSIVKYIINIAFFAILISAVISWFPNLQQGPLAEISYLLSAPWVKLVRRFVPPFSGMDFSPLILLVGLQLLINYALNPAIIALFRLAIP